MRRPREFAMRTVVLASSEDQVILLAKLSDRFLIASIESRGIIEPFALSRNTCCNVLTNSQRKSSAVATF